MEKDIRFVGLDVHGETIATAVVGFRGPRCSDHWSTPGGEASGHTIRCTNSDIHT